MRYNSSAQAALVDAVIFMALMMLASGIILAGSAVSRINTPGLDQYCEEFSSTLLNFEVDNGSKPLSRILCDSVLLGEISDSSAHDVLDAGNALIRPGLGYAIEGQGFFLSDHAPSISDLPGQVWATRSSYLIMDIEVQITVYMWVIS